MVSFQYNRIFLYSGVYCGTHNQRQCPNLSSSLCMSRNQASGKALGHLSPSFCNFALNISPSTIHINIAFPNMHPSNAVRFSWKPSVATTRLLDRQSGFCQGRPSVFPFSHGKIALPPPLTNGFKCLLLLTPLVGSGWMSKEFYSP